MLSLAQPAYSQNDQRVFSSYSNLQTVFRAGEEGYNCFRIPAIIKAADGSLLAFAEGRRHSCSDSGDINLVMKRSEDNGKSWDKLQVVWKDGRNTCGNPAPVVDLITGVIHLLMTWNDGEDHEREIIDLSSKDTRRIFVTSSENHGHSWGQPKEITSEVKLKDWTWYATGPGSGIQLHNSEHAGRLMIACDHIEANTNRYFSHVIYSDDHGATWKLGGTTPNDQVNECELAELSDGQLLLNMRNYDRNQNFRQITTSRDGGMTWVEQRFDIALVEPICQASLHAHDTDNQRLLFFSNPSSPDKRESMTVRVSLDNGETWPQLLEIHTGPAAYSDLVSISKDQLGCLYESGQQSPYEGIVFAQIEINHP